MSDSKLEAIIAEIGSLPKGNLTYKVIRGKPRMYLQWYEGGKKINKYVKAKDEPIVLAQIKRRKHLQEELKQLVEDESYGSFVAEDTPHFETKKLRPMEIYKTRVVTGGALKNMCAVAQKYGERDCIAPLKKYLQYGLPGKVCLIYGLRRTGKTTIIVQAMSELPADETAYIKIMTSDTMDQLNDDLRKMINAGIKYVFIDEVTLLGEFIDSASLFSDVYASMGMKIVLSGTDSLGFLLSTGDELYDRAYTIHTTFIPFKEYSRLLGINDVDEYIRYGGTFMMGEKNFDAEELLDESISFRDDESTRRYIDTAIARNIQHSLANYQYGGHFMHLEELYEAGELTGAINRIIEDMNHRFLISVLTKDFVSHDLGTARQLERKKAMLQSRESILEKVDCKEITNRLQKILDIRNKKDMTVEITREHVEEIKSYLHLLDLIVNCPTEQIGVKEPKEQIIFTQPGMRYCQAEALVHVLMKDEIFSKYPIKERQEICEGILREVRGRMLEDIVLLETRKRQSRKKRVFKLLFSIGEIDMVIYDEDNLTCELYEIKHTDKIVAEQYKHLIDEEKCKEIEFNYGEIISRTVLYRGENAVVDGIKYQNVEEYLKESFD